MLILPNNICNAPETEHKKPNCAGKPLPQYRGTLATAAGKNKKFYSCRVSRADKNRGFSLIESMVAISVLFICLIAVGEFFPLGINIISDSQHLSTAANLAISQIEEIQATNYDAIDVGTIETKHRLSADPGSYLYPYQRQTTADYVDSDLYTADSDSGLKKITVTVYWQGLIGKQEKSINITYLTSKY